MAEIVLPYKPRDQQLLIHDAIDANRFTVVVAHRRMGKTVSAINHLIKSAVTNTKPNPRYAYITGTYAQAKRVAWDYLLEFTRPLNAAYNISELRADFWGRRISLYGSDNFNSLRGQYFDGVVIDEVGDQNPAIWNEIIRPALADRLGWCCFIGTPKGRNHFSELRDRAEKEPGWKLLEFRADQTGIIPEQELLAARKEMGENKYAQEFLCSFNSAIEGSYYGSLINDLEAKSRITTIDRDDLCRSFVAWDLGISDSTSLWVRWLRENKYEGFEQFLPHDVEVRELGTGKSRKEVLQEAGLDIRVAPRLSIADGIQAARRLIPRCWFDHKTKAGLDALRNYRREFNERQNVYYDKPLHDWTSHAADAFRYLAITLDENVDSWSTPLPKNVSWVV
jgi:phage terminase large subunit